MLYYVLFLLKKNPRSRAIKKEIWRFFFIIFCYMKAMWLVHVWYSTFLSSPSLVRNVKQGEWFRMNLTTGMSFHVVSVSFVLWFQTATAAQVLSFSVQIMSLQPGSAFPSLGSVMVMRIVRMAMMSIRIAPGGLALAVISPVVMDCVFHTHTGELGLQIFQ